MKFEDYARKAGKALVESGKGVELPSVDEMTARRRKTGFVWGAVGLLFVTVAAVALAGSILDPDLAPPAATPVTTAPEDVAVEPLVVDLLDGTQLRVEGAPGFDLTGYSFNVERTELGGSSNVDVAPFIDPNADGDLLADLGDGVELWRAEREGQPIFMSIDLGRWFVYLHVGWETQPGPDFLAPLIDELRGEVTDQGVVMPGADLDMFRAYLARPGTDGEGIHIDFGQCFREVVPNAEVVSHPLRGDVIRADGYASWCDPDNDLEVRLYLPENLVDHLLDDLSLERTAPSPQPTPSLPEPGSMDVRWSASGIGMTDGLFPDNRLLAANGEMLFVADGWSSIARDPSAVTAFSAATGEMVWQRTDLRMEAPHDAVFIQLLTSDRLVVNGQHRMLAALDVATGETLWALDLPEGYKASGAVASGDVMYLGAHATAESDIQPPVAYAIHLRDGSVIWQTVLAEGTDLQPVAPGLTEDSVVFSSTLSHPGSAEGNMVHALSLEDGSVLWDLNLGGGQQFKFFPTLTRDGIAIVAGPSEMLGVSMNDGSTLWVVPDAQPLAQSEDGRVFGRIHQGIAEFDWATGQATMFAEVDWDQGVYRPNGGVFISNQLVVSDGRHLLSYSVIDGDLQWTWTAPGVIVDFPVGVGDAIAVPVGNQSLDTHENRKVMVLEAR